MKMCGMLSVGEWKVASALVEKNSSSRLFNQRTIQDRPNAPTLMSRIGGNGVALTVEKELRFDRGKPGKETEPVDGVPRLREGKKGTREKRALIIN